MKKYFESKMILFKELLKRNNYIITDQDNKEFTKIKKISKINKTKVLTINQHNLNEIRLNLVGEFQHKNFQMAALAANLCGLSFEKINNISKKIKPVNGRLELIKTMPNKAKIFVDYAHTPAALLTVIKSLKNHYKEDVTLVFGCGGERDIKKRSIMSKIARKLCKKIYVTDDNPRNENPKKIRSSIIKHLYKNRFIEISNRKKAIEQAIKNSNPFDIILIAGKGHETLQDYGKKIIKISDKKIIKNYKIKKEKNSGSKLNLYWNLKILKKIKPKIKNFNFLGVSINSKEVKKKIYL